MVKLSIYLNYGTSYGKRAIGIQAIEVLLHSKQTVMLEAAWAEIQFRYFFCCCCFLSLYLSQISLTMSSWLEMTHVQGKYLCQTLRKHAYSIILKILQPKNENFQIKKILIFFIFLLKTKIVGTRKNRLSEAVLTSTHNLCLFSKIRKMMSISVNPSFSILKWGLRGSKFYRRIFMTIGFIPFWNKSKSE